jgi:hypothetical protein
MFNRRTPLLAEQKTPSDLSEGHSLPDPDPDPNADHAQNLKLLYVPLIANMTTIWQQKLTILSICMLVTW